MRASRVAGAAFGIVLLAMTGASRVDAATASWSLEPSSHDFGARLLGTGPSAPAVFTFTNTGKEQLASPSVVLTSETADGPGPQVFELGVDNCDGGEDLAPMQTCTVGVAFDPVYPGPKNALISFIDPKSQLVMTTATLGGLGVGPVVSFSPQMVQLGSILVGDGPSLVKVLTVTNSGSSDLSISGISLVNAEVNPNHFAIVGGSCHAGSAIAPGASCTIWITFSPTQVGFVLGELQITDNAAQGFQTIALQGIGFAPLAQKPLPFRVFISQRPPKVSVTRFATFRFGVEKEHVPFACKLDRRSFRPCPSSRIYKHLRLGHHVFKVKPRVRVPGVASAPAVARFRVVSRRDRCQRFATTAGARGCLSFGDPHRARRAAFATS